MFIPGGCFCCEPPEDPCTLSGCTWSSTDMSDTDLTAGTAYHNQISGSTPDGSYEITNAQEAGTGNDAPCRKITIETVSAPHKPDTVYAICWKDNATHNPSTQCPLTSVSFCVESKRHGDSDSGLTDSVVFVVRQNNRIFATAAQSVGVNWKRASGTYTQGSFTEIDGAGSPNFTATGTSIEFGFALKLLVSEDEEPLDVVMFDNLCITKASTCPGGCNTSSCDWLELGSQALSVTPTTGAANYTYGLDGSYGNPQGSHRISVTTSGGGNGQFKQLILYDSGLTVGSLQGSNCQQISNITICLDAIKFSGTGSAYVYFGLYNPATASYVGGVTASQSIGTGQWRSISASLALPSSAPAGTLVHIIVGSSGSSVFHIDNICVKAVYGTCICDCVDNYAVTVSGAGGSGECAGCSSANGTFVMSKITIPSVLRFSSDACAWKAPNVSGVCPSRAAAYAWMLVIGTSGGVPYASLALRQQTSSYTALAGFSVTGFSCEASNTLNGLNVLDLVDGWGGGCTGPATLSVAPV